MQVLKTKRKLLRLFESISSGSVLVQCYMESVYKVSGTDELKFISTHLCFLLFLKIDSQLI